LTQNNIGSHILKKRSHQRPPQENFTLSKCLFWCASI